jgi:hypothetical protein
MTYESPARDAGLFYATGQHRRAFAQALAEAKP